jgi:hypothetical protein
MTDDTDYSPPKKDTRTLATALAAAAAVCMLYAAFTHHWLANGNKHLEFGFGLRSSFACGTDYQNNTTCDWRKNADVVDEFRELEKSSHSPQKLASSAFVPAGWITLFAILAGALGLLASVGLALKKAAPDLPVAPTTIGLLGCMVGLISGCVFVATKPGPAGMVGVGMSFWLFGAGVVMGIVGAQMLAKVIRPPDPEWTA